MAVKLIALDLDVTILRGHKEVTKRTREAMWAALESGIFVVPATGRSYTDIPDAVRGIPGLSFFLTSNGANILDGRGLNSIYTDLIPWKQAVQALHIIEEYGTQPSVHMNGSSINLKTADPRIIARYGNTDYFTRGSVENLADYVAEQKTDVEKIFAVLFEPQRKTDLTARITSEFPMAVSASGPDNVELNSQTASKGRGLSVLCGKLGIRAEETAVVGDSINDISMFEFAGCSVVMGNGENCLKAMARYETDTCWEDGAAKAIEKIVSGTWS